MFNGRKEDFQGTLNYMKKNAVNDKPFTLNKHVRERVDQWNSVIDEAM